jgi:thiosulfate dehydrogenase
VLVCLRPLPVVSLLLAHVACAPVTAKAYGEQLFNDPAFSGSKFNTWSCATCHATSAGDTRMLSGHSLVDAAARPTFWGGAETRLIDAASFCYVYFMRGPARLQPDEPRSRALYEYLASLSVAADAPALPFTVVRDVRDVPRGDSGRGAEVYRAACQACHGELHTGKGRNSELASILPEVMDDYAQLFPGVAKHLVFIEKVRHGQFFGVGGNMPLFGIEQLSEEDLGALLQLFSL